MTINTLAMTGTRRLLIAPSCVLLGPTALAKLTDMVAKVGNRVLIVQGEVAWKLAEQYVVAALNATSLAFETAFLGGEVTEAAIERLCIAARGMDAIIGVGGGKVLDASKLIAQRLQLPAFTIPTSAATCAAWTALANLYTDNGAWLYGELLDCPPQAVALDCNLVATAPVRLLASGIADAMAKWYEAASTMDATRADAFTLAAGELAHHLHKQLVRHAKAAVSELRRQDSGEALRRVIEINVLLAGAVGEMGGPACRSVAAHAVANGLTHLPGNRRSYHGEKVAFGILVQLVLQDRPLGEIEELIDFFNDIGLSPALNDLAVALSQNDLQPAITVALQEDSSIYALPIPIDEVMLSRAISEVNGLLRTQLPVARPEIASRID